MGQLVRIVAVVAIAFCVLASSTDAWAQRKRIVILSVEDAPSPKLRKDIVSLVRSGKHTVISAKTFNKTARRLRVRTLTSENLVRVAKRLRADGVLSGSVTEEGRRYYLRLKLQSGVTGEIIQTIRIRLGRARLRSRKVKRGLRRQLMAAIRQLPPRAGVKRKPRNTGGGSDAIEVVTGVNAGTGKKNTGQGKRTGAGTNRVTTGGNTGGGNGRRVSAANTGGSNAVRGSDTTGDGRTDGSLSLGLDPDEEPGEVRRAADVRIGASVVRRSLQFVLAEQFPEAPNDYIGPLAPGLNIAGDLYPLELTSVGGSLLAAPGFAFRYDTVLGLQTAIDTGGGAAALAPTEQTRYSIGGRLRFRLDSLPMQPTITVGGGIGRLSFMVDPNAVPNGVILDVPNTSYEFFDPGAWLALRVHERVRVEVGGQALLVTDAGEVQQPDQYGGANITSYCLDFGVEYRVTRNWRLRAAGSYTTLGLEFLGNGAQTSNRDGDPGDVDVLGAEDSYIGGVVALGYEY